MGRIQKLLLIATVGGFIAFLWTLTRHQTPAPIESSENSHQELESQTEAGNTIARKELSVDDSEDLGSFEANPETEALQNLEAQKEKQDNVLMAEGLETFDAPAAEVYRKEIESDPHGTPHSLINFAQELTPHIERALTVESYAPTVMEFLENCALGRGPSGEGTPSSAKASCLVNASRIAAAHPDSLKSRFESLKNGVNEHVLNLARNIGLKE